MSDNDNVSLSSPEQDGNPAADTQGASGGVTAEDGLSQSPVHMSSSSRTAEALRAFKRKAGLCEVEGCEHKGVKEKDGYMVCQNHFDNGIDAPPEPIRRGRKRKSDVQQPSNVSSKAKNPPPRSASPAGSASSTASRSANSIGQASSSSRRNTCAVAGCGKLGVKFGYCVRHSKDVSAPIRGPAEYERRYCTIEGCERLRSKGNYCHRHSKDPTAPVRIKGEASVEKKKACSIEGCDRLQVRLGYCSRHAKDPSAPVLKKPAFTFDADARWDELFPQLQAFAKENGHARFPTSKKTDISRFVMQIRSVYRQKKNKQMQSNPDEDPDSVEPDLSNSKLLKPERMEALKEIGFEFQLWTVDPSQWEQRFEELLEYKRQNGNFHVTNRENATLSSWCKTQRQRYKNTMALYRGLYGEMPPEGAQQKATELYNQAKQAADEARKKGTRLQISDVAEAKNMLDPERICKLAAVGFEWELQKENFHESWENRYNELLRFKLIHGHCRVPKSSGDYPQLGQWVKQMRKYYTWKQEGKACPKTFTEERINRLNELGFEWRLKDGTNEGAYAELRKDETAQVARRLLETVTEPALPRQGNEMTEGNRYEPFRANVNMYEQRGWM